MAGWAGVVVASVVAVEMLAGVAGVGSRVVVVAIVGKCRVDVYVLAGGRCAYQITATVVALKHLPGVAGVGSRVVFVAGDVAVEVLAGVAGVGGGVVVVAGVGVGEYCVGV